MEQQKEELKWLLARLAQIEKSLDLDEKRKELRELEARAEKPDFWQDQEAASQVMRRISFIKEEIEKVENLKKETGETLSVAADPALKDKVEAALAKFKKEIVKLESVTFLSGKYDSANAILGVYAGQGGVEAMDWAQMLLRMYLRYAERRGWRTSVVDQTPGEEAGIKSATVVIEGPAAYGYLRGEAGTHRLVRQSPFNADKLRQTSFALVEILPKIAQEPEVEIKEDDLEWQFFRASSQGGQNVQKVSSAARVRHKPTGIVVSAQSERFQEQNRKIALSLLLARLWQRKMQERKTAEKEIKGEYHPASWGTQIRSYILYPYKMVKDLRTGVQTADTEAVLAGVIDDFIQAELSHL